MKDRPVENRLHDHVFGLDRAKPGEQRTLWVIAITAATMIIEIAGGGWFGSMALLADGLHMGSHASALGIAAFAYRYTRRHAGDPRYCFGTGKVNSLAAFASAVLLGVISLLMAFESMARLVSPVAIVFNQAIGIAVFGLAVNGVSLLILRGDDPNHSYSDHGHDPSHSDHNLMAATLHVMADAFTSVLAIFALVAAKYFGWVRMDPVMGILGAALVVRWAIGLLRISSRVLLDHQAPPEVLAAIRGALEGQGGCCITDLHVWSVGPGIHAAEIVMVADRPLDPGHCNGLLPTDLGLVHVTFEIRNQKA